MPELRSVSSTGQCLLNIPTTTLIPTIKYLAGQIYSIDNQCKIKYGSKSSYSLCSVRKIYLAIENYFND